MKNNILKIGQEIIITKDFNIESSIGAKPIPIKKGARAFVKSNKVIRYTTGTARGLLQPIVCEFDGYDHENIATIILNRLMREFELNDFLEDYGISKQEIISEIEDVLEDIL